MYLPSGLHLKFIRVIELALQSDPVLRPTLEELVESLASMSGRLLAAERAYTATAGNAGAAEAVSSQKAPLAHGSSGSIAAVVGTDSDGVDDALGSGSSGGAQDGGSDGFIISIGGIDDPAVFGGSAGGGGASIGSDGGSDIDAFGGRINGGSDGFVTNNGGIDHPAVFGSGARNDVDVFGGQVGGGGSGGVFGADGDGVDDTAMLGGGGGGGHGVSTGCDDGSEVDVFSGHVGGCRIFGTGSGGGDEAAMIDGGVGGGVVPGGGDGGNNVVVFGDNVSGGGGVAGSDHGSDVDVFDVDADDGGFTDVDESGGDGSIIAVCSGNLGGGGSVASGVGGGVFDTGSGGGGRAIPSVPRQASGGDDAASPLAGGTNGGIAAVGMAAGGSPSAPMSKYPSWAAAAAAAASPVDGGAPLNGSLRYMPRATHVGIQRGAAMPPPQHQRNGRHKSRRAPKPTRGGEAFPLVPHHHQGVTRQGIAIGVGARGYQQAARSRLTGGGTGGVGRRPQHSGFKPNSRKGTVHQRQGLTLATPQQRSGLPHPAMGGNQGRSARSPCFPVYYPSGPPTPPSLSQPTSGAAVHSVGPGAGAAHPSYGQTGFEGARAGAWGGGARRSRSPKAARAPDAWCPAFQAGSWRGGADCDLAPPYCCGPGCDTGAPATPHQHFYVWVPVPYPPTPVWVPCR